MDYESRAERPYEPGEIDVIHSSLREASEYIDGLQSAVRKGEFRREPVDESRSEESALEDTPDVDTSPIVSEAEASIALYIARSLADKPQELTEYTLGEYVQMRYFVQNAPSTPQFDTPNMLEREAIKTWLNRHERDMMAKDDELDQYVDKINPELTNDYEMYTKFGTIADTVDRFHFSSGVPETSDASVLGEVLENDPSPYFEANKALPGWVQNKVRTALAGWELTDEERSILDDGFAEKIPIVSENMRNIDLEKIVEDITKDIINHRFSKTLEWVDSETSDVNDGVYNEMIQSLVALGEEVTVTVYDQLGQSSELPLNDDEVAADSANDILMAHAREEEMRRMLTRGIEENFAEPIPIAELGLTARDAQTVLKMLYGSVRSIHDDVTSQ